MTSTVFAGEPTTDLSPKEAVRLIAMRSNVRENMINIAFIVDGSKKACDDFEMKQVRRVAAIHGGRDGTVQGRKVVFYDLFWNESLGWFMWESQTDKRGEAVYIWSELKGEIVIR